MANRPSRFKQADLTRAAMGVMEAGLEVDRVEIDQEGKIIIIPRGAASAVGANPCDRLLK
ncbi:MAG: hypothetical protein QM682_17085 [Paracoccus sp. (in: a-proteobacteria)]|uniref:hypothetical protein n=1 Tax=Paracoccus sp. TaxID=267 RepID=UPI0039E42AC1